MATRRLHDPPQRVAGLAVGEERLDGRPEREGEVERADEQPVDARRDRHRVDLLEGLLRLHHDEATHPGVRRLRVRGPCTRPQGRERPPAPLAERWVPGGTGGRHGIRHTGHGRDDDRGGAGVQGCADPRCVHCGYAHEERCAGSVERAADRVERDTVYGPVLGVDNEPVEPTGAQPAEQVHVTGGRPDPARRRRHTGGRVCRRNGSTVAHRCPLAVRNGASRTLAEPVLPGRRDQRP